MNVKRIAHRLGLLLTRNKILKQLLSDNIIQVHTLFICYIYMKIVLVCKNFKIKFQIYILLKGN